MTTASLCARVRALDRLYLEWDAALRIASMLGTHEAAVYCAIVRRDYEALRDAPYTEEVAR